MCAPGSTQTHPQTQPANLSTHGSARARGEQSRGRAEQGASRAGGERAALDCFFWWFVGGFVGVIYLVIMKSRVFAQATRRVGRRGRRGRRGPCDAAARRLHGGVGGVGGVGSVGGVGGVGSLGSLGSVGGVGSVGVGVGGATWLHGGAADRLHPFVSCFCELLLRAAFASCLCKLRQVLL